MGLRVSWGGFAPTAPTECTGRTLPPQIISIIQIECCVPRKRGGNFQPTAPYGRADCEQAGHWTSPATISMGEKRPGAGMTWCCADRSLMVDFQRGICAPNGTPAGNFLGTALSGDQGQVWFRSLKSVNREKGPNPASHAFRHVTQHKHVSCGDVTIRPTGSVKPRIRPGVRECRSSGPTFGPRNTCTATRPRVPTGTAVAVDVRACPATCPAKRVPRRQSAGRTARVHWPPGSGERPSWPGHGR